MLIVSIIYLLPSTGVHKPPAYYKKIYHNAPQDMKSGTSSCIMIQESNLKCVLKTKNDYVKLFG